MKVISKFLTPARLLALTASVGLCLCTQAQDVPSKADEKKNVDLDERVAAERGVERLRTKTVQHFKSLPERQAKKLPKLPPPNIMMAPDEEKKHEQTLAAPQRQSLARNTKAEYVEPDTVRSRDGVLRVTLNAAYAHNHIGDDPVHLRALNGKLVGPTFRAKPGDKLRVTLKNTMPGERWLPHMMNTLNSFNTLNMHYHGLHVSPNGVSDNILIQVGPSETQEYEIDIPANHTTGTYWYHPHRHGSTAGDVASGMSGALIIEAREGERGLDNVPAIKAARERVMVLNQIPYIYKNTFNDTNPPTKFDLKEGVVEAKYADFIFGPGMWNDPGMGRYTTVNGVQLPVIRMRPGQVERWRLVDSGQREMILLKLILNPSVGAKAPAQINFHEVAVDGLALGKMVESPSIELWPGYRSDVLVQAPPVAGEYLLIDDASPAGATISGTDKPLNYVARIVVEGAPDPMKLPTNEELKGLRLPSIPNKDITGKQEAKYGILLTGTGALFTIDGKSFDMETARTLKLGDVDEWTLRTANSPAINGVTHPFHIHVNPFEVTSIMAPVDPNDPSSKLVEQLKGGPVWRDTVKIPGGGYVKMRTRYTDFVGTFVQHCHILDHEDQGMMQLIDIVDPKAPNNPANANLVPRVLAAAPDFSLPDADGKSHSLKEVEGKPAVVFFFKGHGCLHCVQQVAAFTEQHDAFAKKGIRVIGVTTDGVADLKRALGSAPCPFLLLADPDGAAFAKYGCVKAGGVQHGTFLIDTERRVAWRTVGGSPYMAVKDLLAQPVPAPDNPTRPDAPRNPEPNPPAVAADPDAKSARPGRPER